MENDANAILAKLNENGGQMTFQELKDAMDFPVRGQLTYAMTYGKGSGLFKEQVVYDKETKTSTHYVKVV